MALRSSLSQSSIPTFSTHAPTPTLQVSEPKSARKCCKCTQCTPLALLPEQFSRLTFTRAAQPNDILVIPPTEAHTQTSILLDNYSFTHLHVSIVVLGRRARPCVTGHVYLQKWKDHECHKFSTQRCVLVLKSPHKNCNHQHPTQ